MTENTGFGRHPEPTDAEWADMHTRLTRLRDNARWIARQVELRLPLEIDLATELRWSEQALERARALLDGARNRAARGAGPAATCPTCRGLTPSLREAALICGDCRARFRDAPQSLQAFATARGAHVCRRCGQLRSFHALTAAAVGAQLSTGFVCADREACAGR